MGILPGRPEELLFTFPVLRDSSPAVIFKTKVQKMAEGSLVDEQNEKDSTEGNTTQFCDHPVFREISLSNGRINKMKKAEVKRILAERGLDSR